MSMGMRSNAHSVARQMLVRAAATQAAVVTVTTRQGAALQGKVKAKASGRPGPRAQTGDYRRSIALQVRTTTTRTTAEVYTNAVQGWRLEMGFYGLRDSLGRLYHQPPYPHFQPAADEMRTVFPTALETGINLALRGTR
jgi:hypothetical protein